MLVARYLKKATRAFRNSNSKCYTDILRKAYGCGEKNMEESPSLPCL